MTTLPEEAVKAAMAKIHVTDYKPDENDFLCMREAIEAALPFLQPAARSCTCHPDDTPPVPCAGKYALSDCRSAARELALEEAARVAERHEGEPCRPASAWTEEQRQFYTSGQQDASSSIAAAIRALSSPDHAGAGKVEGDGLQSTAISNLIEAAKEEAAKAMRKFPQPNYVISKIAEEAGEVVKAAIHCAEGRENPEAVIAEIKQTFAMLFRLLLEGDEVHGLSPLLPSAPASEGSE